MRLAQIVMESFVKEKATFFLAKNGDKEARFLV
jgi:hypothetical protein